MEKHFILASGSPRRKELLESIGMDFDVVVSDADESSVKSEDITVDMYVQELALIKAAASAKKLIKDKKAIIISADTVVACDGKILGKPADEEEAFLMLSSLSGRGHEVYTGICVMSIGDGRAFCKSVKTSVYFKRLTEEKIRSYIRTKEPMDKAGAYGIQGKGGMLVEKIDGDYQNVVGLSVSALSDILENEFDIKLM